LFKRLEAKAFVKMFVYNPASLPTKHFCLTIMLFLFCSHAFYNVGLLFTSSLLKWTLDKMLIQIVELLRIKEFYLCMKTLVLISSFDVTYFKEKNVILSHQLTPLIRCVFLFLFFFSCARSPLMFDTGKAFSYYIFYVFVMLFFFCVLWIAAPIFCIFFFVFAYFVLPGIMYIFCAVAFSRDVGLNIFLSCYFFSCS
jgi:hypothetical protein